MTTTIAVAGKGGTGKTTLAAMLSLYLAQKGIVLAIDGDPSSNLHLALGMQLTATVGDIREEMAKKVKKGSFDAGISKPDYIDFKIREALVESDRIDLLAMGRPEGPGCYCAANNMLRVTIDRISSKYDYVVIDNEAGMEHISRQTTRDVDVLLLVSDYSVRGLITAAMMKELIKDLRTGVGRLGLVINRMDGPLSPEMERIIRESQMEITGVLPTDCEVVNLEIAGKPLKELPPGSILRQKVLEIAQKLGL